MLSFAGDGLSDVFVSSDVGATHDVLSDVGAMHELSSPRFEGSPNNKVDLVM